MWKISERKAESYKIWAVAVFLAGACLSLYYFHVILRTGTIVTHLFYVPIILASIWWKRKGLVVALFSSAFLIFSHVFLRPDAVAYNDYLRAFMFIVTAFVVAELSRRIAKEHEALLAANQQLTAGEQQLKAANQQLRANEQQLVSEITERKKAEGELQETTRFLETIFDTTHVLIVHMDPQFNFIKVNKAYALADEKEPSFFPGKNHFDLYPNEENEAIFRRVVETAESYFADAKPFEYAEHPERGVSYWDWSLIPIKNQSNGVTGLVLSIVNVTERKQAEEALRESEGKLSAMLRSFGDHMSMMDKDLNIIWANEKARNIFGDDIVGMKCHKAYHQRNKPCEPYPCLTLKAFQDGKVHEHDTQVVGKDGKNIYFHCTANVALRDTNGKPTAVLEISRDITESKKAEQAIWASESEKRSILNAISDQILFHDTDLTIRWVNEASAKSIGMTQRELVGCYCYELWHGRSEPCERCPVLRAIETRSHTEGIMTTPDGRWWEIIGEPVCDRDGKIKGAIEIARDISDRKKAEEALRESENSYRAVVENAVEGIVVVQDQTLQFVNPAIVSIIGYSEKELLTRPFIEFVHPDHREWAIGIHTKRLKGEEVPPVYELKVIGKKGNTKWLENSGILIKWRNRPATLNFLRDITERKEAQEVLKYRIEFERLITMLSKKFIDPGDIDEKINQALKAIGQFAKVDRAYIFQLRDDGRTVDNTHEWCAERIEPQIENLKGITLDDELPWFWEKMKAHETFHVPIVADLPPEAHLEKKHFEMQGIQALVVVPMLSKGVLKGFLGFDLVRAKKTWAEDIITLLRISGENISMALEREHAEQRARLLSSTVEQSSEGMGVIDLQGNLLFLNNAFAVMHGYTPEELIGRNLSVFHTPEQLPYVEVANQQTKETGEFNGEIWHVRRDGTVFLGLMHNSLLRNEAGNPIGMIGTLRDITESKKAEQALKESEIKFRSLTEESLIGVYLIQDGIFKYVNPELAGIFGYSPDELIDKKGPDELVFPEDWPLAKENLRRKISGEIKSTQYAFRGITKDKEIIYIEVYDSATQYQGRPAVIGTLMDITERKQAEKKLLEYQVQLKSLASQLSLIEERERHDIARELHDQISQSLVISKTKLDSLRKSVSPGESKKVLKEVCDCLGQVIQDTRTLTFDLSSPILYELGFEAAVAEWLEEQIRQKHVIETKFQDDEQKKPLDEDIRALLFRNVRELLINVVRHANAKNVKVSIRKVDNNICVSVEDDGVGFDVTEVESMVTKKAKFGLFSIRERLESVGGRFEIASKVGHGSKITMTAPLKI